MIGATADHSVFDIENTVEDIERTVIVGDYDNAGFSLVGDFGEKFHDLTA